MEPRAPDHAEPFVTAASAAGATDPRAFDPRWVALALVGIYLAVFARALGFEFVWDDDYAVVDNALLSLAPAEALRATMHDYLGSEWLGSVGMDLKYESYRPALWLSFKLDDWLFERSAMAMHAHNLILGALGGLLVWDFARRALPGGHGAGIVTALFLLHPVQVEALCYVSARADLLAAAFCAAAASALFAAGSARGPARILGFAAAPLAYAAALAAKEAALGLPVALLTLALASGRARRLGPGLGAMAAAALVYAAVRASWIRPEASHLDPGTALDAALHLPGLGLQYLGVLLLPTDLSIERISQAPSLALAGWLVFGALTLAGVAALGGRIRRGRPALVWAGAGSVFWLAMLAPSAVAVETMGVAADRYVTFALLGPALAGVGAAASLRDLPRWAVPASALWGALLVGVSAAQVEVWRDEPRLYANALALEPESATAHYRSGVLQAEAGVWGEAAASFERAVELDPQLVSARNNLSLAYLRLGRPDLARDQLERALETSADRNYRAWNTLAVLHFGRAESEAGCAALERSLAIHPDYDAALRNRSQFCGSGERGGGPRG